MVYHSVISPSETVKIECLYRVFASTADASLSELSYDWNKTDQYEDTGGLHKTCLRLPYQFLQASLHPTWTVDLYISLLNLLAI